MFKPETTGNISFNAILSRNHIQAFFQRLFRSSTMDQMLIMGNDRACYPDRIHTLFSDLGKDERGLGQFLGTINLKAESITRVPYSEHTIYTVLMRSSKMVETIQRALEKYIKDRPKLPIDDLKLEISILDKIRAYEEAQDSRIIFNLANTTDPNEYEIINSLGSI